MARAWQQTCHKPGITRNPQYSLPTQAYRITGVNSIPRENHRIGNKVWASLSAGKDAFAELARNEFPK